MSRYKLCEICSEEYNIMYRIIIDNSKKWIFSCKSCLEVHKPGNMYYKYGGTWKKWLFMSIRGQNRSSKISILSDGRGIIKYHGEDIFIAKNHLNGAFDKDEVHFSIQRMRYAPYKKAKVLKVIKATTNTFIGRVYL